jgi:ATPase involved in DNA repair
MASSVSKSASGGGGGGGGDEDDNVSVSSMRSSATGASNRSRLEEIRQRRLELQRNKNKLISPPPKNVIGIGGKTTKSSTASASLSTDVTTPVKTPIAKGSPRLSSSKKAIATTTNTTTTRKTRTNVSPLKSKQENLSNSANTTAAAGGGGGATVSSPMSRSASMMEVNQLKEQLQEMTVELQNKENHINSLSKELEIKQTTEKSTKEQIQSLMNQLSDKDHETRNLQNQLRDVEQISHDAQLALEASKAEVVQVRKKLETALNDAKLTKETENPPKVGVEDVMASFKEQMAELHATNEILVKEKMELDDVLTSAQREISSLRHELDRTREVNAEQIQTLQKEISEARSQAMTVEKELSETTEKAALRDDKNAAHYKEKAKLQAEILSWQRKVQELEKERIEANNAFEDLTLDKEQLAEKLEMLQDKVEELKIDAESAQIEVDELRLELQDARDRAEKAEAALAVGTAASSSGNNMDRTTISDSDEITQALSVQNSRLREAIIRLREQTAIEKMELSRQLRAAEKESSAATSFKEEIAKLVANEKIMKREIKELKDMVDQGSAFEQMVEDLSERVLAVEDNNISLQATIRELEEGAEISAEMEETQAEEIKMLMMELQNRDTVVVNLEEAIKMYVCTCYFCAIETRDKMLILFQSFLILCS